MNTIEQQIADAERAAHGYKSQADGKRVELKALEAELRAWLVGSSVQTANPGGSARTREHCEADITAVERELKAAERNARLAAEHVAELHKQQTVAAVAQRKRDALQAADRLDVAGEERVAILHEVDALFDQIGALLAKFDTVGAGILRDLSQLAAAALESHPYGSREHARLLERHPAPKMLGSALCSALIRSGLHDRAGAMVDVGYPVEQSTLGDFAARQADGLARQVSELREKVGA